MKLTIEQLNHLIDLLEIDNTNKPDFLSDELKKKSIEFNNRIIKKLEGLV
jgi:hypothetical protein